MFNVCSKISFQDPNEDQKENSKSGKVRSENFDFVPSDWLKSYISNPQTGINNDVISEWPQHKFYLHKKQEKAEIVKIYLNPGYGVALSWPFLCL